MRTNDGQRMTWKHATLPLGSALRIAPAFTATATADDISVETTISAVMIVPPMGPSRCVRIAGPMVLPSVRCSGSGMSQK